MSITWFWFHIQIQSWSCFKKLWEKRFIFVGNLSQIRHSVPHWRSPTSACWSEPGEARGSLFFHLNLTGWNSLKHCRRPMGQTPDLKHWRSMRLILDRNILVELNDGLASQPANSTGTAAFQSHEKRCIFSWWRDAWEEKKRKFGVLCCLSRWKSK